MEKEYFYIVNERHKIVAEFYGYFEEAETIAVLGGCALYEHFPYEEYGYEDPYNFIDEWEVYSYDNYRLGIKSNGIRQIFVDEGELYV